MLNCPTQAHAPTSKCKCRGEQRHGQSARHNASVRLHRATHNCKFVEAQHVHHAHLHSHWSDISAVHAIVLHDADAVGASGSLQIHAVSGPLTWASTAANRSGRWLAHAATSRPPFDPPCSTHHHLCGRPHLQNLPTSTSARVTGLGRGDNMQQPGQMAWSPIMCLCTGQARQTPCADLDRGGGWAAVALRVQVLRRRLEVIEHVLLVAL